MLRVRGQADSPARLCALQAVCEHGQGLHVAARAERKEKDGGGSDVRAHGSPLSAVQALPANGTVTTRLIDACRNLCGVRDTEARDGQSYNRHGMHKFMRMMAKGRAANGLCMRGEGALLGAGRVPCIAGMCAG